MQDAFRIRRAVVAIAAAIAISPVATPALSQAAKVDLTSPEAKKLIDRGRYLAKISGCNDCHTAAYMPMAGKVPEKDWLTGDSFGWRGPWGTTYAVNLRLYMQPMTEAEWMKRAMALETRPPMPWWVFREMHKDDLRAIYRYIRFLGPAGQPAPAYVPPDKEPKPPYATFPAPPK